MAKRIYWETVKLWAIKSKVPAGIAAFTLLFMYMVFLNVIDITGISGDMACSGTEEDPCLAFINFTVSEDVFIYPIGYDPWGRETPFYTDKGLKSWKMYRSWGDYWREIKLDQPCTATWCGAPPDSPDNKYAFAFRAGREYRIKIVALKENPYETIKWGFGPEDPFWYGVGGAENVSIIELELGSQINITANISGTNTVCVDIDHPAYGDNYTCGSPSANFLFNVSYFRKDELNDSSTKKNLSFYFDNYNQTAYITAHQYDELVGMSLNLTLEQFEDLEVLGNWSEPINDGDIDWNGTHYFWTLPAQNTITVYDENFQSVRSFSGVRQSVSSVAQNGSWIWALSRKDVAQEYNEIDQFYHNGTYHSNFSVAGNCSQTLCSLEYVDGLMYIAESASTKRVFVIDMATQQQVANYTHTIGLNAQGLEYYAGDFYLADGDDGDGRVFRYNSTFSQTGVVTSTCIDLSAGGWGIRGLVERDNTLVVFCDSGPGSLIALSNTTSTIQDLSIYVNNSLSNTILGLLESKSNVVTSFNDSSTTKNLTFSSPGTSILYVRIPKVANVTSAFLNLSGWNNTWFVSDNTEDATASELDTPAYGTPYWYAPFGGGVSDAYDENWATVIWPLNNPAYTVEFTGRVFENYTIPQDVSAANVSWKYTACSACSADIDLHCYDSGWQLIQTATTYTSDDYGNPDIVTKAIPSGCFSGDTLSMRVTTEYDYTGTPGSSSYYEQSIDWYYINPPNNLTLEVGVVDGNVEFEFIGGFEQTNNRTDDFSEAINDFLLGCTADETGHCTIPFHFTTKEGGVLGVSDLDIAYGYEPNPVVLNHSYAQSFLGNSSGFANIPIKFVNDHYGRMSIDDIRFDYAGGNDTIEVLVFNATDGDDRTVNESLDLVIYYSDWDFNFPQYIDYLEFIPTTSTSKNVTPYGQTLSTPIFNFTTHNYGGKNMDLFVLINETGSCVDLFFSNNNTKPLESLWDELIAYYPFDIDARDIINDINGTVNGATLNTGNLGGAYEFDGTNDYLNLTNNSILNFGTGNFSISFWAKSVTPVTSNGYQYIYKANDGWTSGYTIGSDSSQKYWFAVWESGVGYPEVGSTSTVSSDWQHVVGTKNGTDINIYIDGVYEGTTNNVDENPDTNYPLLVGIDFPEWADYFNGSIDELRIYNRTLSSSEVSVLYGRQVNKYYDSKLSDDWTAVNWNLPYLNSTSVWMWADYNCSYSNWAWWFPDIYVRGCCVDCVCSEDLT